MCLLSQALGDVVENHLSAACFSYYYLSLVMFYGRDMSSGKDWLVCKLKLKE